MLYLQGLKGYNVPAIHMTETVADKVATHMNITTHKCDQLDIFYAEKLILKAPTVS